ncbi:MAG TPA: hypothetical protein PKY01_01405 [Candidatus Hydrogenedentes bacterium]|nr:hypothetical protein [Candidatus Hydrogenedentota bacterium]
MADDKPKNGKGVPQEEEGAGKGRFESDSGLGNLPPLSDFESTADTSDTNLPPLDGTDSGGDLDKGTPSGLPPISDIPVETPVPSGRGQAGPPDFESPSAFDTPTSASDSALDTPQPETAFQDLAADSDFTPETPELGPGPDTDMETPLFDSAFGSPETPHGIPDTGAPTQAMETPMFGADEEELGFDEGAFTPGAGSGFGSPTPAPDFHTESPEPIGMPAQPGQFGPQMPMPGPAPAPQVVRKGGISLMVAVILALVAGVVGLAAGYFLWPTLQPMLGMSTNPLQQEMDAAKNELNSLRPKANRLAEIENQLAEIGGIKDPNELVAEINRLTDQKKNLDAEVKTAQEQAQQAGQALTAAKEQLATVESNLKDKLDAYAEADEDYQELLNQISIVRARDNGLRAEVDRLEGLVGTLEESNARRVTTKEALTHATERLTVILREGMPLVPAKFSVEERTAKLKELQENLKNIQWVTPEALEQFTSLFLNELEIARTRTYFFARIPVKDRFGVTEMQWAECVMNGNWSVFYRTLDGTHIGTYENMVLAGPPVYEYRDMLPQEVQKSIEETIIASRTKDYEEKVLMLAERQEQLQVKTEFQGVFDSLE